LGQVTATMVRAIRELVREKSALFWTIAWPIIWVLLGSYSFVSGAPEDILPYLRGAVTIPMMIFAIMIAGMSNLPASVANDRHRGMLTKLMSMPLSPWRDFAGRILGLACFSCIAVALVALVGFAVGARFTCMPGELVAAIGFLVLVFVASAGLGAIIASLIKPIHGAIMTGVGVSVITAAIGGMFTPYEYLPSALQTFSRFYPVSSANSAIIYLLSGPDYAGYDPLSGWQVGLAISLSTLMMALGIVLYSRYTWKRR
jgi:ABC-2 type transport system permease protein